MEKYKIFAIVGILTIVLSSYLQWSFTVIIGICILIVSLILAPRDRDGKDNNQLH